MTADAVRRIADTRNAYEAALRDALGCVPYVPPVAVPRATVFESMARSVNRPIDVERGSRGDAVSARFMFAGVEFRCDIEGVLS